MNTDELVATMSAAEYAAFLNELLEAERAGAKLLAAYDTELPPGSLKWRLMRAVQQDEARNCAILIHLLLEAEATPTQATGSFYARGLAIEGWRQRLHFLNRGQAWVARRLDEAIARVPAGARTTLQAMHDSHVTNIERCEGLL